MLQPSHRGARYLQVHAIDRFFPTQILVGTWSWKLPQWSIGRHSVRWWASWWHLGCPPDFPANYIASFGITEHPHIHAPFVGYVWLIVDKATSSFISNHTLINWKFLVNMLLAMLGQECLSIVESCATYHGVVLLVVQPVHCCVISTLNPVHWINIL